MMGGRGLETLGFEEILRNEGTMGCRHKRMICRRRSASVRASKGVIGKKRPKPKHRCQWNTRMETRIVSNQSTEKIWRGAKGKRTERTKGIVAEEQERISRKHRSKL